MNVEPVFADGQEWRFQAACRGSELAWFDPVEEPTVGWRDMSWADAAKALCATCQVQPECLGYALLHRERGGVWGGLTFGQRQHVARALRRRGVLADRSPAPRRRPTAARTIPLSVTVGLDARRDRAADALELTMLDGWDTYQRSEP